MSRRAIASLVVLLAAVGLAVLLLRPEFPAPDDAPETPTAPPPEARLEGVAEPQAPRTAPPEAPAPTAPKTERVHGTLRVGGVAPARFTVQVEGDDPRRSLPFRIDGTDGAFDADAVPGGRSRLRVVRIDGRDVDLPLARGVGDAQSLEVGDPVAAALIVVDRATKAPLNTARALRWDGDAMPTSVTPPFDRRETTGARARRAGRGGRIDLPASTGHAIWLVVDDEHAWRAVEVRYGEQETLTVELEPGGRAHLTVLGWRELVDASVWVTPAGAPPERVPGPDPVGNVWIDGLPFGDYEVVLRGRSADAVLATTRLPVTRERPAEAELDGRPRTAAPHRIVLTFEYDRAWGDVGGPREPIRVRFAGADPETRNVDDEARPEEPPQPDRPNRVVSRPLPPGAYRVELAPFGWRGDARIADADVRLDVRLPRPGTVEARIRDAVTRAPVARAMVWWRSAAGVGDTKGGSSADDGIARLRVVPGRIVLWSQGTAHRLSGETTLDVLPGQTVETVVDLVPKTPLRVAIREGGVPAANVAWTAALEVEAVTGRLVERRKGTGPTVFWEDVFAASAVLRIELPAEYATPEPRTLDLRRGVSNEVVFDLVRKP